MPVDVVLGLQYGDEGKGRVVYELVNSEEYQLVVRARGGSNAGHTVIAEKQTFHFHLIPSGAAAGLNCLLGGGMVIHPEMLCKEIDTLVSKGIKSEILIDQRATIVTPWHLELDAALEKQRSVGGKALGTTKQGIGPAYADRVSRNALNFGMLKDFDQFCKRAEEKWEEINRYLSTSLDWQPVPRKDLDIFLGRAEILKPRVVDGVEKVRHLAKSHLVLAEGAQGAMLDLDLGTYPYVTSSNTTLGGILSGTGISWRNLRRVYGVAKAYTTRVGAGPFPTKIEGDLADQIRQRGFEFGVTTGRSRDVGWLNLDEVRYASDINGITHLILTKLDILSGVDPIRVQLDGKFQEFEGWQGDISSITEFEELPSATQKYLQFIFQNIHNISQFMVMVGPHLGQTIHDI